MNQPVISVIVPIYNTEQYLRQCVDSILGQTYQNIEVILVDDGSTDGCPMICDEYKESDGRVHVYHRENGGQAKARNFGLSVSGGDLISFVDSDDWLDKDMFQTMIDALERSGANIACCGTTLAYLNGNFVSFPAPGRLFQPEEALRDLLTADTLRCEVCNKIFERNLFSRVRFPEGRIYEDQAVVFQLIGSAKSVIYTGQDGYFYRRRPDSSMANCNPVDGLRLFHRNLKRINKYLSVNYPDLLVEIPGYRAQNHLWYMTMCVQGGLSLRSREYRTIKHFFMKDFEILFARSDLKQRIKLLILAANLYGTYWRLSGKKIHVSGLQELSK